MPALIPREAMSQFQCGSVGLQPGSLPNSGLKAGATSAGEPETELFREQVPEIGI